MALAEIAVDPYALESPSLRDAVDQLDYVITYPAGGDVDAGNDAWTRSASAQLGRHWLQRVRMRLMERADKALYTNGLPKTEQQALALVKQIAGELQKAGDALNTAAEQLRARGGGVHAAHARQAALCALHAAEGLR